MSSFVVRENIDRFRKQLDSEADPANRAILQRLLTEEEAKLKGFERRQLQQRCEGMPIDSSRATMSK
jgi:hypothetical protein